MKMTYTEFLALVNRADKIQEKLYTLKEEQIKEYSSEKMRHINFLEYDCEKEFFVLKVVKF